MASISRQKIGAILVGLLFLFQNLVFAQEAKLTNIIVTNTRDDLLLYLNVEGAFREKTKDAILSGVFTTFSFFIALYLNRNFWFDKKIADITITHTIKYNNIKKEYSVKRSWENGEAQITQSFREAQKLMTEIDSLKILPLYKLKKGMQYQIRAKAELSKLTLPLYLHYVLFFVSLWDFETDWYTIDFIY
ncbi:hypothetical protein LCGC14_2850330 [marine sediment metagenome]|uniref:DUF4390 domain-containing protein n=1 Tax=marine sediment metagenome TaxID=412755 RepID=A0A0F8Y8R9_9ZZZZ|nr:DUF4390 domain-containing protein [Desulfobacterales bacterium]